MAARRCSMCGINYPPGRGFETCPVHGSENDYLDKAEISVDWERESARMLKQFESDEEARIMGPVLDVAVKVRADGFFVDSWDTFNADGKLVRLVPDQLFRVGRLTFEVIAYIESSHEYLVRPLETAPSDESLAALCGS